MTALGGIEGRSAAIFQRNIGFCLGPPCGPGAQPGLSLSRAPHPCGAAGRFGTPFVYWVFGPDEGASAALGSCAGWSDLLLRYVMTSARSLPRGNPANVMDVPGMNPFGLVRKWLRSSGVHLPPLPFMAAE